jgi:hypothetical protein
MTTTQPTSEDEDMVIPLGNGAVVMTGVYTVLAYRNAAWRVKKARQAQESISHYQLHLARVLQPQAAAVLLPQPTVTPAGQRFAQSQTNQQAELQEIIGSTQAAQILRLSPRTVSRKAAKYGGQLIGGRWCFDRAIVAALAKGAQHDHDNKAI